jgi:hypothetical protein
LKVIVNGYFKLKRKGEIKMSSGPVFFTVEGSDDEENLEIETREYINKEFTREDWCSYKGQCPIDDLLVSDKKFVCCICSYRRKIGVPELLYAHREKMRKIKAEKEQCE